MPNIWKFGRAGYGFYYNPNYLDMWIPARDSLIKDAMTHEFSHAIGMEHIEDNHIMKKSPPIQLNPADPDYGRFFWDPNYSPTYSDSCRRSLTVRPQQ